MATSRIEGVAELSAKLKALGGFENGRAIRAAARAGAKPIVQRAKAWIPVGSKMHRTYSTRGRKGELVAPGFSKRSIRSAVVLSRDKQGAKALIGVRKKAFYATQFVEVGTSKMAAKPWLRPALRATASQQEAAIADSLRKSIERIAKTK